ncbi:unnamed protein product, partial [Ectocarpus sp. 12 AP-2014]
MGLSLKQQADTVASAETARFEAKEAEIKKASQKAGDVEAPIPDKGKGNSSSNSSSSSSSKAKKTKKDPEARARRKELSKVKSTLGRLQRRVDGFWYSKFPFAGASGFRKRVLLAMEKDVTLAGGLATDRIRVYRPLTGAKDYSRAKLRESYEKVSVDKARGYWREEYSGERNEIRFKHFVILAGSVLPVWRKVEGVLNANTHTQHERRLRIVRATEKEDEWNNMPDDDGTGENGKEGGGGRSGDGDKEGAVEKAGSAGGEASGDKAAGDSSSKEDEKPCCEVCGGSQDVGDSSGEEEGAAAAVVPADKGKGRGRARPVRGRGSAAAATAEEEEEEEEEGSGEDETASGGKK